MFEYKKLRLRKVLARHRSFRIESATTVQPKNGTRIAFTIVARNYIPYALTVRESFLRHNPSYDFTIILLDMLDSADDARLVSRLVQSGVDIVCFQEIKNRIRTARIEEMLFKYTVLEMSTAIKPYVIEYLFNSRYEVILYLDPDLYFFGPITELEQILNHSDVVLTPHILQPYQDDRKPAEMDILKAGTYNLGFIALKNTQNTARLVQWWEDRLYKACFMDPDEGMHVDQKWIDLVPSLFEKVYILKHRGYNAAYWNLHERKIKSSSNSWKVSNGELVFFHFSGFVLEDIDRISKHQNRYTLSDFRDLRLLFEQYREALLKNGIAVFRNKPYYYDYITGTAIRIPSVVRRYLWPQIIEQLPNPFLCDEGTARRFIEICTQDVYGDGLVNNVALAIWRARKDLQISFPNLEDKGTRGNFHEWFTSTAVLEYELDEEFTKINNSIDRLALAAKWRRDLIGVNIIGYFSTLTGVAEAARLFVKKIYRTGLPYAIFNLASEVHAQLNKIELDEYKKYFAHNPRFTQNLFFVNADEIGNVRRYFPHLFTDKTSEAVWWWELEDCFKNIDAFQHVDVVVAHTDFVRDSLRKAAPAGKAVVYEPYPFMQNWQSLPDRQAILRALCIEPGDFVFLFAFDFFSGYERKNPHAVISAFERAFRGTDRVWLVIKASHAEADSSKYRELVCRIKESKLRSKIVLLDRPLSRDEVIGLVNSCDCYVSLHRSEGLGLGMLEAMYLGKPVIATRYGGNLQFMNESNSLLVDYKMALISEDHGPYKKGCRWAEPDVDCAAEHMRNVYSDQNFAHELGKRAMQHVQKLYDVKDFALRIWQKFTEYNKETLINSSPPDTHRTVMYRSPVQLEI